MDVVLLHCQVSVYVLPTKLSCKFCLAPIEAQDVAKLTGMQSTHTCVVIDESVSNC